MPTALFEKNEKQREIIENNILLKRLDKEITSRKHDYTGAEKEQFAYQVIGNIFDQALEYKNRWTVKAEYKNIEIYAVTLPTLSEINNISHSEGDKLLKGWIKHVTGNFRVFHNIGADFLIISRGSIEIPTESGKPIQDVPRTIAYRKIELKQILERAKNDMVGPGNAGETSIAKREFIKALLEEVEYQKEEEKLLTTLDYFKNRKKDTHENIQKYYEEYVRYLFEGVYLNHVDVSKSDWVFTESDQTIKNICSKVAVLKTLGYIDQKKFEQGLKRNIQKNTKIIDKNAEKYFIKTELKFRTERATKVETVETYLKGKGPENFPIKVLKEMLDDTGIEGELLDKYIDKTNEKIFAQLILNRFTLGFDKMTGFKEKDQFYTDIVDAVERGTNPTVAIVDLGYLKYFNYLGNRALGDHAIKKSAWILQHTSLGLKNVDMYRIGGDEFGIKTLDEESMQIIQKRLEIGAKEVGIIPSNGYVQDLYETQKLEFNVGICTFDLAQKVYKEVRNEYKSYENEDKDKKRINIISKLLIKIADINLDNNKTVVRLQTIARKGKVALQKGHLETFKKFVAFSSKALRGISIDSLFEEIEDINVFDENLEMWENILKKLTSKEYHYGNSYTKQLVMQVKEAIKNGTI